MAANYSLSAKSESQKIYEILRDSGAKLSAERKKDLNFLLDSYNEENKQRLLELFNNWYIQDGPHINMPGNKRSEAKYQALLFSQRAHDAYKSILIKTNPLAAEVRLCTFSDSLMSEAWLAFMQISARTIHTYLELEKNPDRARDNIGEFANRVIGIYDSQTLVRQIDVLERYITSKFKVN